MTRQSGKQIARTAKRPAKFIQSTESSVQLHLIDDSEENISFSENKELFVVPDLDLTRFEAVFSVRPSFSSSLCLCMQNRNAHATR